MKKSKRALTIVLSAAMCVSLFAGLTGCGDNDGSGSTSKENGKDPGNTTSEYVYDADFIPVKYEFESDLSNVVYHDGRFLASSWGQISGAVAVPREGGAVEEDTVDEPEASDEDVRYGMSLYWLDMEGNIDKIEGYKPMETPENGDAYTQTMTVAPNGNIIMLDDLYSSYYDGPEDLTEEDMEYWDYWVYNEDYYLRVLSPDGTELSCTNLTEALNINLDEEYFYPSGMEVDGEGNCYVAGNQKLYVLDSQGELLFTYESENYLERVVNLGGSQIMVLYWGEKGYELAPVDMEQKSLGEGITVNNQAYEIIPGNGSEYDLYYTNGSNFFGYDLETGESTKLYNWINCNVNSNNSGRAVVLPDGRIICVVSNWNKDYSVCESELAVITKKPASSVPQRTVLTFATQYLDYELRDQIINFNKTNGEFRIEVKDYSEYNTDEDYSAGLKKLTTEIMSNNVPDIIDLSGMSVEQLGAKGLLEDLYPYMENDSEIHKEDFFPNVLAALETDGKLYRTVSTFNIQTVIGASALVGDKPGWTVDEFKAAYATMPEGCTVFDQYTTQSDILQTCLFFELDSLVDWNTGKCSFDTPVFTSILEFASSFPSEFDWENYDWSMEEDTGTRIASGKQMLYRTYVSDFTDLQYAKAMYGGTDITCIGFPTESGVGNMFAFNGIELAISSKCQYKEAAWEFVRYYFTEEYADYYAWGFPVNKTAFDEKLKEAMTPIYMKDDNGNFILDEEGNKIEQSRGGYGMGNGQYIELYAVTQEEADLLLSLIESTTKTIDYNNRELVQMVVDECEPYFAGQKSAEDVARLVQSKINIYVNEQR